MRRALLTLETCRVSSYPFKPTQAVQLTDWEVYINQIGAEILAEQSPPRSLTTTPDVFTNSSSTVFRRKSSCRRSPRRSCVA